MKSQLWKHHPYSFCAAQLFGNLCQLADHVGEEFGTIDVVFGPLNKRFVGAAGDEIRKGVIAAVEEDSPEHARRLGTPSWSRADERAEHVPLQAADLLVWHIRRRWDEPDGPYRRALRELKKATRIRYCAGSPGVDLQGIWASTKH
jgi:hypothetical protein